MQLMKVGNWSVVQIPGNLCGFRSVHLRRQLVGDFERPLSEALLPHGLLPMFSVCS